jgi:hypothetical protein
LRTESELAGETPTIHSIALAVLYELGSRMAAAEITRLQDLRADSE